MQVGARGLFDRHSEFATCAESRRAFVKCFLKDFMKEVERLKTELDKLECRNNAGPEVITTKEGEDITVKLSVVWRELVKID
jgi:hypothetical protein